MRSFLILVGIIAPSLANGQVRSLEEDLQAEIQRTAKERPPIIRREKPNEIVVGNRIYSGIMIQAAKTDNPLQLVNPAAPTEYGSPEDNVVRDPITGKVSGLKLFSVSF